MITGFQLKAAKIALDFTASYIGSNTNLHAGTIVRLYKTNNFDYLPCNTKNLVALQTFFEHNNLIFSGKNTISLKMPLNVENYPEKMTRFQLKIARVISNLTQEELGFYTKVSSSLLSIIEKLDNYSYVEHSKLDIVSLKRFFEHMGITFPTNFSVTLIKEIPVLAKKNNIIT